MNNLFLVTLMITAAASLSAQAETTATPHERPLQAPGPLAPLEGLLMSTRQAGDPVVLIVPGSGPTDRDGNNPLGVNAATYRLLANELAGKGIATLRIDKRGMFHSARSVADPNAVTLADYAADVHGWLRAAREATGAACVWVLGHSEGGLVALLAGEDERDLCGLILLATPGRKLGIVMREQLKANPANAALLDQAFATLDALEAGRRVDPSLLHPALARLFRSEVQGFLISELALDPAALIGAIRKPVLVLQGERDIQVGVADARRLAAAAPTATLILLPNTNHVLKRVETDDRAANAATYGNPDLPLAPGVADAVAGFVLRNKDRR